MVIECIARETAPEANEGPINRPDEQPDEQPEAQPDEQPEAQPVAQPSVQPIAQPYEDTKEKGNSQGTAHMTPCGEAASQALHRPNNDFCWLDDLLHFEQEETKQQANNSKGQPRAVLQK